jgi:adenine C2-methylase RlmN of 23S rRNA A2503 and tRNA A37
MIEYINVERREVKRILKNTNLKIIWKNGKYQHEIDELNLENFKKIRGEYLLIGKWIDTTEKQEFVGSLLIVNTKHKNEYAYLTESNKELKALFLKKLLSNNLKKAKLYLYTDNVFLVEIIGW